MPAFPKPIPAEYPEVSAIPLLDLCSRQLSTLAGIDYAIAHVLSEEEVCARGRSLSEAITVLQVAAAEMCSPVAPRLIGLPVPFIKKRPPVASTAFQKNVLELAALVLPTFLQHAGTGRPVCQFAVLKMRAREENVHTLIGHMKAQLAKKSKAT